MPQANVKQKPHAVSFLDFTCANKTHQAALCACAWKRKTFDTSARAKTKCSASGKITRHLLLCSMRARLSPLVSQDRLDKKPHCRTLIAPFLFHWTVSAAAAPERFPPAAALQIPNAIVLPEWNRSDGKEKFNQTSFFFNKNFFTDPIEIGPCAIGSAHIAGLRAPRVFPARGTRRNDLSNYVRGLHACTAG